MPKLRDSQKTKLYRWERLQLHELGADHELNDELDLKQVNQLMTKAWERYRGTECPPTLKVRNEGKWNYYSPSDHLIKIIGSHGATPAVVLHEVAHAILDKDYIATGKCSAHGPMFARLMIDLWKWYSGTNCLKHAKAHIKVASSPLKIVAKRSPQLEASKSNTLARIAWMKRNGIESDDVIIRKPKKQSFPYLNQYATQLGIEITTIEDLSHVMFPALMNELNIRSKSDLEKLVNDSTTNYLLLDKVNLGELFAAEVGNSVEAGIAFFDDARSSAPKIFKLRGTNTRTEASNEGYRYHNADEREDWWIYAENLMIFWATEYTHKLFASEMLFVLASAIQRNEWLDEFDYILDDLNDPTSRIVQTGYLPIDEMGSVRYSNDYYPISNF